MKKLLKINNSKLQIEYYSEPEVKNIPIQHRVSGCYAYLISSEKLVKLNSKMSGSLSDLGYFVLSSSHSVFPDTKNFYSIQDENMVLSFISVLPISTKKGLDWTEQLVRSTNDSVLINLFYKNLGYPGYKDFLGYIKSRKESGATRFTPISSMPCRMFNSGQRVYSVFELLSDLSRTGSSILINPELTGDYSHVSTSRSKVHSDLTEWNTVRGLVFNSTRSNVSLSLEVPVDVEIPENEYGISSGLRRYKSIKTYCIIASGLLNMPKGVEGFKIGVCPKTKGLYTKLSHTKMYCPDVPVLHKGTLVLDLTKAPVVNSGDIVSSNILSLSRLHVRKELLKYGLRVLSSRSTPKKPNISDSDKFLRSLGICEGYYKSPRVTSSSYKHTSPGLTTDFTLSKYPIPSSLVKLPEDIFRVFLPDFPIDQDVMVCNFLKTIDWNSLDSEKQRLTSELDEVSKKYSYLLFKTMMSRAKLDTLSKSVGMYSSQVTVKFKYCSVKYYK